MQYFNKNKMDEMLRERGIPRKELKNHVARVKNDAALKELVEGNEKIGVDQLLAVVNFLGVSVSEFFVDDGGEVGEVGVAQQHAERRKGKAGEVEASRGNREEPMMDDGVLQQLLESERLLHKERLRHKEEVHRLELEHLGREADLRVALAKAEAKLEVQMQEFNLHSKVYHGYEEPSIAAERVNEG